MIIHTHFHPRATGITRSIENITPILSKHTEVMVFGYGIKAPKIGLQALLKAIYSDTQLVIHTHRNNEIIFALLLKLIGGRFKLLFTRHSDTMPSKFTQWLMKRVDILISLNPLMAEKLPVKNTLVRHGVDTSVFNSSEKKYIKGIPQKKLIAVIGRLRSNKGQLTVIEALSEILIKNPEWGLLFIGKIDQKSYVNKLFSVIKKNSISHQVHFIPENQNIVDYYQASSIVIIASLIEGFSLVCLEAMACGLVTVATKSVGIHSEVIKHGENGFLFPKNDTKALSSLVSEIISQKITLDPQKTRQTILENWSVEKQLKELLKLYEIE